MKTKRILVLVLLLAMMVTSSTFAYAESYKEFTKNDLLGTAPTLTDATKMLGKSIADAEKYVKATYQYAAYSIQYFNKSTEPAIGELVIYDMNYSAIMNLQFQVVNKVTTVVAIHEVSRVEFTSEYEEAYSTVISKRWENTLLLLKKFNPVISEEDISDESTGTTGFSGSVYYTNAKKNVLAHYYLIEVQETYSENYWTYQLWNSIYLSADYYPEG